MKLKNRQAAGEILSKLLVMYQNPESLILAIPRGGVLVAAQIAKDLNLDLDLMITKKILHPNNPNKTIGAIAEDGNPVFESNDTTHIQLKWLNEQVKMSRDEIKHRRDLYRNSDHSLNLKNRDILLVSDGVLSGLSVLAAVEECIRLRARKVILVTPGISLDAANRLQPLLNKVVAITVEDNPVNQVEDYYSENEEVSDQDVIDTLRGFPI